MAKLAPSNLVSVAVIAAVSAYGFANYQELPAQVATHFDLDGNPNGYSGKLFAVVLLPLLSLVLLFLIPALLKISPRGYEMKQSRNQVPGICLSVILMLATIQLGLIENALHSGAHPMSVFLGIGFAIFLVGFGNSLGKVEPNFIVGIRTPWSIASHQNWLATHRFGGRVMVCLGIGLLISNAIYPSLTVSLATILVGALLPVIYSYRYFRKNERAPE